jgi:deoxycytidylate deaminase
MTWQNYVRMLRVCQYANCCTCARDLSHNSRARALAPHSLSGFARGVDDDESILANPDEKIKLICNAEQNAIVNAAHRSVSSRCIHLCHKIPLSACCNAIIQAGITLIRTDDHKYWDDDPLDADHSRKKSILRQTHLKVGAPNHPDHTPNLETIRLNLGQLGQSERATKS